MKKNNYFKISLIYFTAILSIAVLFILSYFGFIKNEWLSSFLIQIVVMFAIPLLMYSLLTKKSIKTALSDTGFKKISKNMLFITILIGLVLYFLNQFVATIYFGKYNTVLQKSIHLFPRSVRQVSV